MALGLLEVHISASQVPNAGTDNASAKGTSQPHMTHNGEAQLQILPYSLAMLQSTTLLHIALHRGVPGMLSHHAFKGRTRAYIEKPTLNQQPSFLCGGCLTCLSGHASGEQCLIHPLGFLQGAGSPWAEARAQKVCLARLLARSRDFRDNSAMHNAYPGRGSLPML